MSIDKSLADFSGWEENKTEDVDFFGTTEKILLEEEPEKEEATETTKVEADDKKPEEEKKVDTTFSDFEDTEPEVKTGDESVSKDKESVTPEKSSFISSANLLKEKGFISFELEEGTELTEDQAAQFIENGFEDKVEERVEELFEDVDPLVKQLTQYSLKGGDIKKFLSSLKDSPLSEISPDLDITQEKNQELVIRKSLEKDGEDEDYISAHIDFLRDSKKMESIAEKKFDKWIKEDEKVKEQLVERQKEAAKLEKQNRLQLKSTISTALSSLEDLGGLPLSKKDKKDLPAYMTDRSIKLEGGGYITPMQKRLHEVLADHTKAALLAKLIQSDFDFSAISTKEQTKVTQEVKKNLQRSKDSSKITQSADTGSSRLNKKSLADFFND